MVVLTHSHLLLRGASPASCRTLRAPSVCCDVQVLSCSSCSSQPATSNLTPSSYCNMFFTAGGPNSSICPDLHSPLFRLIIRSVCDTLTSPCRFLSFMHGVKVLHFNFGVSLRGSFLPKIRVWLKAASGINGTSSESKVDWRAKVNLQ